MNDYCDTVQAISLLPNNVIERFIAARAPQNPIDRIPLEQVSLNYTVTARQIAASLANALSWFNADTRSLLVENQFDYIGDLNQKARHEAHWKNLNRQIDQLGGVDQALFSDLPAEFKLDLKDSPAGLPAVQRLNVTNLTARLEKLLNSTNYTVFVGLDDKKYSFTPAERELIIQRGKEYFTKLNEELVKQICTRFEDAPRDLGVEANGGVSEDDVVAKLEQRIMEIAKYVVTARDETNRIGGKLEESYVAVPVFKYDQDTRVAAAKMLGEKGGSFKGWSDDAKGDLNSQLKKVVENALNIDHFKDFKVSMLSRPLRDWYQQQQELLAMLPPAPPSPGASPAPPLPSK